MPNNAEFMHEMQLSNTEDRSTPDFLSFMRAEINRLNQRQVVFTMPGNGATIVVDRCMHHANI